MTAWRGGMSTPDVSYPDKQMPVQHDEQLAMYRKGHVQTNSSKGM